jgi:hypothetical protein
MVIFKSKLRRKIEINILKLRMERSDIEREQLNSLDTSAQGDRIIRKHAIDHDIELLKEQLK